MRRICNRQKSLFEAAEQCLRRSDAVLDRDALLAEFSGKGRQ